MHFRGKARLPYYKQLLDHSTFLFPYKAMVSVFPGVSRKPFLDVRDFPELTPIRENCATIADQTSHRAHARVPVHQPIRDPTRREATTLASRYVDHIAVDRGRRQRPAAVRILDDDGGPLFAPQLTTGRDVDAEQAVLLLLLVKTEGVRAPTDDRDAGIAATDLDRPARFVRTDRPSSPTPVNSPPRRADRISTAVLSTFAELQAGWYR